MHYCTIALLQSDKCWIDNSRTGRWTSSGGVGSQAGADGLVGNLLALLHYCTIVENLLGSTQRESACSKNSFLYFLKICSSSGKTTHGLSKNFSIITFYQNLHWNPLKIKITLFACFRPPSISLPFFCLGILCLPVCVHFFGIWGDLHWLHSAGEIQANGQSRFTSASIIDFPT